MRFFAVCVFQKVAASSPSHSLASFPCRCRRMCDRIQWRLCPRVHQHPRKLQVHVLRRVPPGSRRTQLPGWGTLSHETIAKPDLASYTHTSKTCNAFSKWIQSLWPRWPPGLTQFPMASVSPVCCLYRPTTEPAIRTFWNNRKRCTAACC